MIQELDTRLADVVRRRSTREKLTSELARLERELSAAQDRRKKLAAFASKEKADMDRLEGVSLAALFYSVRGEKDIQLKKERQEYVRARLLLDQCEAEIAALSAARQSHQELLVELADVDVEYRALLAEREQILFDCQHPDAGLLLELAEARGYLESQQRETEEARQVGRQLLEELQATRRLLDSARSWGTWDLLGGGLLATVAKHSRLDEARGQIQQVQQLAQRFERELGDVVSEGRLALDIDSFVVVADYFLDGLISDWLVQSRIQGSIEKVDHALRRVRSIMADLERSAVAIQAELDAVLRQRSHILEHPEPG